MSTRVRELSARDIPACALIAWNSPLRDLYRFTVESWSRNLETVYAGKEGSVAVAEHDDRIVGFAWFHEKGAFLAAPYLRFIAVDKDCRSLGIGKLLLEEYERRTSRVGKDFFLLVSDFNTKAIDFYTRHGYHQAGVLPDFAVPGVTELIMVKKYPSP